MARRLKTLPFASARPELRAVRALRSWISVAELSDGPLWRAVSNGGALRDTRLSVDAIYDVIKRLAGKAGLDPERISPHSLRAEHVTEAKRNDASDLDVMSQTHHARADSLFGYVREADPFRHTSAKFLGL